MISTATTNRLAVVCSCSRLEIDPKNVDTLINKSCSLHELGKYVNAIVCVWGEANQIVLL
jgi:hypothetical protein